ncbi:MAG: hypothetical protein HQL41_03165 [Alphaproteobacteria bacterium]|nr:hypothetical protein [Alphaproteobacteria bacterium]
MTLFDNILAKASDQAKATAAAVISGADWVGQQSAAAARAVAAAASDIVSGAEQWMQPKIATASSAVTKLVDVTQKIADQVNSAVEQAAPFIPPKIQALGEIAEKTLLAPMAETLAPIAQQVKSLYLEVDQQFDDLAVDVVTVSCDAATKALYFLKQKYADGLRTAAEQRKPPEFELQFAKASYESGEPWEFDLGPKISVTGEDSFLRYGDDDASIGVGQGEFTVTAGRHVVEIEASAAILKGDKKLLDGPVDLDAEFEVLAVAGDASFGFKQTDDFTGVKAGLGVEAALIKGAAEATTFISPKSVYDRTLGHVVGLVVPEWRVAPTRWGDVGLVMRAEGEAGIAAAAELKGHAGLKNGVWSVGGKAKLGFGPMAGIDATVGLKIK